MSNDGDLSFERAMDLCSVKQLLRPAAGGEWPKMFYHAQIAPLGQVFENAEEFLKSDVNGWGEQPLSSKSKAKHSLLGAGDEGSASNGAQK